MFHYKSGGDDDDDEIVVASAVAVAAEPERVRLPKPSDELLVFMTPFCRAYAEQHWKEFGVVVNELIQWAITEAPKFNMTWEEYIRGYIAQQEAEEAAFRNQYNLQPTAALKKDQETPTIKVETSCSNAATHDNRTMELLISRLEKVATSMESNCNDEIATLKSSLEKAREKYEKETSSLRKEISDQRKELDDVRGWDQVDVTWIISCFDRAIDSCMFNVGQHSMRIKMQVAGDRRYGYLGFSICHVTVSGSGYDRFPIQLGGSRISVVGNEGKDTETKVFVANAAINEAGRGLGWIEFVAMKDLEKKFLTDGKLTLKAEIRVPRSTFVNLKPL